MQVKDHKKGIDRAVYGPYLLLLQPQQLAVLALHGEPPRISNSLHCAQLYPDSSSSCPGGVCRY